MNKQLSLFEMPQPHQPQYGLVLGIFPDHDTRQKIYHLGNSLCEMHGLHGRMRPISHLHVSVPLPRFAINVPKIVIEIVSRACQTVSAVTRPFEIKLDQVMSFQGRPGNYPLVLVGDNHGNDGVRNLHGLLWAELTKHVSANPRTPKFVPHLTLLYDKQRLDPTGIRPVSWTVREIVLVASEVGATKYHRLGRWEFIG